MNEREALRMALEALKELKAVMPIFPKDGECIVGYKDRYNAAQYQASNAITAIKQALEQPEPKPVAWMHIANENCVTTDPTAYARGIPLYTSPPKREWQGLTDEEIAKIICGQFAERNYWVKFARAIEAKLKEKNN